MALDLFTDEFFGISGTALHDAITELQAAGMREGYRIDYKEVWNESHLKHVAAFANTVGGIIVIGVSDDQGRIGAIPGMAAKHELTTQLANSIASNISPTPFFEIAESQMPTDRDKRLAVIRIRRGQSIHFLLKKGEPPVYVRSEDQSVPANAPQLRALIERQTIGENVGQRNQLASFSHGMWITRKKEGSRYENPAQYRRDGVQSETWLRVTLVPERPQQIAIDKTVEIRLWKDILNLYPIVADTLEAGAAQADHIHSRDSYSIDFVEPNRDHHMTWRTNTTGAVGFVTQSVFDVKGSSYWSLNDTIAFIVATIRLTHKHWSENSFLGDGHLQVGLKTELTKVARTGARFESVISTELKPLILAELPLIEPLRPGASADFRVTFADRTADLLTTMTSICNALLRDFGFSVEAAALHAAITKLDII